MEVKALQTYQEFQIYAEDWGFQPTGENPAGASNSLMRGRLIWQEVEDGAVRAIPVIGLKLTDVQKITKTAKSS